MWGAVAGGWAEHADFADARGAAVTERMLALGAPGPGDRVLELAAGPGGPGLAAAERVGAAGEVVISDVAPEMTAIAAARARALGLANVRTRELDLEAIDEPDGAFDVVLCREGLMLVPDPARAAHEISRVLRPGGRVALAVWGPRERNPWLCARLRRGPRRARRGSAAAGAARAVLARRRRPAPGDPGRAGLADVAVDELPTPYRAGSFDEWWTRTSALAGPLAKMLAGLPEPGQGAPGARPRGGPPLRDAHRAGLPRGLADRSRHPCRVTARCGARGATQRRAVGSRPRRP